MRRPPLNELNMRIKGEYDSCLLIFLRKIISLYFCNNLSACIIAWVNKNSERKLFFHLCAKWQIICFHSFLLETRALCILWIKRRRCYWLFSRGDSKWLCCGFTANALHNRFKITWRRHASINYEWMSKWMWNW